MSEHDRGQLEASAAVVYDELFVPALFGRFAGKIEALTNLQPDESAIDVACGTGALTRELAKHSYGHVEGVDISHDMLTVARRHGGSAQYTEGDAMALPFEDDEFDVATCQFGIMFLDDPAAGLAEMAHVAKRGVVAVWDSIETSQGYLDMQQLFRDELGDDAAASLGAPFSLGRPGVLARLLADAGIHNATFERIDGTGRFDSIEQWVTTEVRGWTLDASVTDDQLADLVAKAEVRLAAYRTADGCEFPMTAKVACWP